MEEPIEVAFHPVDSDLVEVDLKKSKARTSVLVHDAECSILEMQRLLGKNKTGTATRAEKDRLLVLNSKLSALKKDIGASKTVEKDTELKLLRSKSRSKVADVHLAMKERDICRALHAVQYAS